MISLSKETRGGANVNLATRADIAALRVEMQTGFQLLEQRMTIRLGGLIIGATGLLLAAARYFPTH